MKTKFRPYVFAAMLVVSCQESGSFLTQKESLNGVGSENSLQQSGPDETGKAPEELKKGDDRKFVLTGEQSVFKPVVNLVLVIDNSFSMTEVQATTAAALEKLFQSVIDEALNINVILLSTSFVSSVTPGQYRLASGAIYTSASFFNSDWIGGFGANNFRADKRLFFEMRDGRKVQINSVTDVMGDRFIIRDPLIFAGSRFADVPNGVVSFRIGQTKQEAQSLLSLAVNQIQTMGTAGSSVEQPLGVIRSLQLSDEYKDDLSPTIVAIVTNEDDSSYGLPSSTSGIYTAVEQTLSKAVSQQTRFRTELNSVVISAPYLALNQPSNDGVVTSSVWNSQSFSKTISTCNGNPLCLTAAGATPSAAGVACTEEQKNYLQTRFNAETNPSRVKNFNINNCVVRSSIVTTGDLYVAGSLGCDSEQSPGISFTQYYENRYPGALFARKCFPTPSTTSPNIAQARFAGDVQDNANMAINSAVVGSKILEHYNVVLGPRGYAVALISNLGGETCPQTASSVATRLLAFHNQTPTPGLRTSVCASSYQNVVDAMKLFITNSPVLSYEFPYMDDVAKITGVEVTTTDGLTTSIPIDQLKFENSKVTFPKGSILAGAKVTFTLKP